MVTDRNKKTNNYLSVRQIAEMFGLTRATVYDAINSGKLPAVRFERSIRVRQDDLDLFLEPVYQYHPYRDAKRGR